MEGHADMLSQSAKDQWELDGLGSSPYHLPSWSLARRPPSNCPNTRHCLEICVTLTEEIGAVPPPSHSWMALLMADILCDVRTRLTKAVVTGPGRVVLFYGRCSMGEGLTAEEATDATILLTGAGMWVGKSAYLATEPWQSKKVNGPFPKPSQITEWWLGTQGIHVWIHCPNNPSGLTAWEVLP